MVIDYLKQSLFFNNNFWSRPHFGITNIKYIFSHLDLNFVYVCLQKSDWQRVSIYSDHDNLVSNKGQAITWTNDDCSLKKYAISCLSEFDEKNAYLMSDKSRKNDSVLHGY